MGKELTKDEKLKQAKADKELADGVAKELGYDTINDLMETANGKMKSGNQAANQAGVKLARAAVENLALLMLYQTLEGTKLASYTNFGNRFDDGYIANGNAKQYIVENDLGVDTWEPTMFVPTELTDTNVEQYIIQMYNQNGQLNTQQAYQFKKVKVLQEPKWLPYFKEGNLARFISILREEITRTYEMWKFDKIAKKITTSTPKLTVEGTAENLFTAMTDEVLPILRELTTYTSKYNYGNSNHLNQLDSSDILVLMNGKTIQRLQSGIKSQLFNAHLLDFRNIIGEDNVINLGNQLQIGDGKTQVTVNDTPYVPEDTIWIMDKSAVKHVLQINRSESQSFAMNLTIEIVLHVWGALDILPWKVLFKYHNENLKKNPD